MLALLLRAHHITKKLNGNFSEAAKPLDLLLKHARPLRTEQVLGSVLLVVGVLGKVIYVFADSSESACQENERRREWLMRPTTIEAHRCSAHGEHAVSPTEVALFVPVALHAAESDLHGSKCDIYLLMD